MVQQVLAAEQIMQTKTTKSGKTKEVNLRSRLFTLALADVDTLMDLPKAVRDRLRSPSETTGQVIRYTGSCRNDGTLLRPQGVVTMLESVSDQELALGHIHRVRLILSVPE